MSSCCFYFCMPLFCPQKNNIFHHYTIKFFIFQSISVTMIHTTIKRLVQKKGTIHLFFKIAKPTRPWNDKRRVRLLEYFQAKNMEKSAAFCGEEPVSYLSNFLLFVIISLIGLASFVFVMGPKETGGSVLWTQSGSFCQRHFADTDFFREEIRYVITKRG